MLYNFFGIVSSCLVFFVFYNLIHGLLGHLTDAGNPYAVVSTVHWVILGLVSLLSLASWGLFVAWEVLQVTDGYDSTWSLMRIYVNVAGARSIVYWVMSLEILAWAIFVIAKAGSHRFNSKVSPKCWATITHTNGTDTRHRLHHRQRLLVRPEPDVDHRRHPLQPREHLPLPARVSTTRRVHLPVPLHHRYLRRHSAVLLELEQTGQVCGSAGSLGAVSVRCCAGRSACLPSLPAVSAAAISSASTPLPSAGIPAAAVGARSRIQCARLMVERHPS